MSQDTVDETVDSILVKEGRVEITFLFYSNCLSHSLLQPYLG